MKILAIALGSLAIAAAASAHAQYGRDRPDDSRRVAQECWNQGAGHFEAVRPGERQDDLDFSRCRPLGGNWRESRRPSGEDECWNPHARHFEAVRPGERQDDLDFSRCRPMGDNWRESRRPSGDDECWNSHARHYEAVRPGERQDDLDFSRCRPRDERH